MEQKHLKWLETAKWAMSGGNAQPWAVSFDAKSENPIFEISIDPAYRQHASAMDVSGIPSVMALGGFVTCLSIAAENDGYADEKITLQPGSSHWEGRVVVEYRPGTGKNSRHFTNFDVESRRSDRNAFQQKPIPENVAKKMRELATIHEGLKLTALSHKSQPSLSDLDSDLKSLEILRWQNRDLVKSLLAEVSFGNESKISRDKIPASQLGASLMDQWTLRLIRRLPPLQQIFHLGAQHILAERALQGFLKDCDRVYFLSLPQEKYPDHASEFRACFEMGCCLQEQWIEVNKAGLSFQILGLPLVALAHWRNYEKVRFSSEQKNTLAKLTENFQSKFGINLKTPVIGFRVGYPTHVAEQAPRRDVVAKPLQSSL